MLIRYELKLRPQTVTDNDAAAAILPLAVNTRMLVEAPEMAAAVAAIPVVAEAGVPLTNDTGNVTVIVSELTRAVVSIKPMTILRLIAATRSMGCIVSNGAVTTPPMGPVEVAVLAQSRVVATKNPMLDAIGEPMVMVVNVSV